MASKRPSDHGSKRAAKTRARRRARTTGPTPSAAERSLRSVLAEFTGWLRETDMGPDAEAVTTLAESALTQLTRARAGFETTAWTPDDAHALLDLADAVAERSEEAALRIVASSLTFLDFLDRTDLWDGSDENLAHCLDDLEDYLGGGEQMIDPADIELPDIGSEREKDALAALPVMTRLDTLLDWVGTGRDLTPSSLHELARLLGSDTPLGSEYDAPEVIEVAVAARVGLIAIDDGEASAADSAQRFRARSDLDLLRMVLTRYVEVQLLSQDDDGGILYVVDTLASQSLLAAMLPDPPPNSIEESYEELDPDDRQIALLSGERLRTFTEQQWLIGSDTLVVPPELRRAVLAGIEAAFPLIDETDTVEPTGN